MPQLIARRVITKADLAGVENHCICNSTNREIEEDRAGVQIDAKLFGVMDRAGHTARHVAAE